MVLVSDRSVARGRRTGAHRRLHHALARRYRLVGDGHARRRATFCPRTVRQSLGRIVRFARRRDAHSNAHDDVAQPQLCAGGRNIARHSMARHPPDVGHRARPAAGSRHRRRCILHRGTVDPRFARPGHRGARFDRHHRRRAAPDAAADPEGRGTAVACDLARQPDQQIRRHVAGVRSAAISHRRRRS